MDVLRVVDVTKNLPSAKKNTKWEKNCFLFVLLVCLFVCFVSAAVQEGCIKLNLNILCKDTVIGLYQGFPT